VIRWRRGSSRDLRRPCRLRATLVRRSPALDTPDERTDQLPALEGSERVLEVGTGLGYQAALLAQLALEVWSIERHEALAEAARANLAAQRVDNAHVVVGDGSAGLRDRAPFDAIVVAAAHPLVPAPLVAQLRIGGPLVQPIGPSGAEDVTLFRRAGDGRLVRERSIVRAHFVPLRGRHGA
jgi:protein-L-isoaspartate(D-aspartate) O-methyltransferase